MKKKGDYMNTNRNASCYGNHNMSRNTGYSNQQMKRSALDGPCRTDTRPSYHSAYCSNTKSDPCGIAGSNRIDQFPVGMAYVPWQEFKDLYDPHQGLCHGTMFKELDYPFYGKRGNCR